MLQALAIDVYYGACRALTQVSQSAETGKVTCILGRNGVGKTSLIRAVSGMQSIKNGSLPSPARL